MSSNSTLPINPANGAIDGFFTGVVASLSTPLEKTRFFLDKSNSSFNVAKLYVPNNPTEIIRISMLKSMGTNGIFFGTYPVVKSFTDRVISSDVASQTTAASITGFLAGGFFSQQNVRNRIQSGAYGAAHYGTFFTIAPFLLSYSENPSYPETAVAGGISGFASKIVENVISQSSKFSMNNLVKPHLAGAVKSSLVGSGFLVAMKLGNDCYNRVKS